MLVEYHLTESGMRGNLIEMETCVNSQNAERYKERLNIALKAAKICVFEVDIANQLYTFFENAEDIFGVSGEVILKEVQPFCNLDPDSYRRAVSEYFSHPDDIAVIEEAFKSIFDGKAITYEARMRAGGSGFVWCKIDVTPIIENGVPVRMIGVITDITTVKTKINELEHAVKHDSFTGLWDKKNSIKLMREALSRKSNRSHALVIMDIDNFKMINDLRGHAVGDMIISLVSETLKNSFRDTDIIGRFGGDEFILLIRNIPDIQWLTKRLQQLTCCEKGSYRCTNSIGASIFPQNATDFDLLLKQADEALYQSKLSKASYTFYSEREL